MTLKISWDILVRAPSPISPPPQLLSPPSPSPRAEVLVITSGNSRSDSSALNPILWEVLVVANSEVNPPKKVTLFHFL